jgi:SAM-dependent methyltransferase
MGEAGFRMLEGWDIPYRDMSKGLAVWDTGRTSSELKNVVEEKTIRPCRAVELGCGTGTDSVYLAGKGFEVTAIDIAPTALSMAEQKAEKAGVKVEWLLADVLRAPELEPFDFLYDRGCYHAVRRDYPKEYVAAVRRLTRQGGRILILAGNAKEDSPEWFAGPPRVTEKEIRDDFAEGFKLLSLREIRFDPTPPRSQGALAWSVLLERTERAAPAGRSLDDRQ